LADDDKFTLGNQTAHSLSLLSQKNRRNATKAVQTFILKST